jgi:hypothetical protein
VLGVLLMVLNAGVLLGHFRAPPLRLMHGSSEVETCVKLM